MPPQQIVARSAEAERRPELVDSKFEAKFKIDSESESSSLTGLSRLVKRHYLITNRIPLRNSLSFDVFANNFGFFRIARLAHKVLNFPCNCCLPRRVRKMKIICTIYQQSCFRNILLARSGTSDRGNFRPIATWKKIDSSFEEAVVRRAAASGKWKYFLLMARIKFSKPIEENNSEWPLINHEDGWLRAGAFQFLLDAKKI